MRRIVVKDNQSLFDICIQEYGNISNVVALAQSNEINITDELTVGQQVLIPELTIEQNVLKYYAENKVTPATAQLSDEIETLVQEGESDDYFFNYLLIGEDNSADVLLIDGAENILETK